MEIRTLLFPLNMRLKNIKMFTRAGKRSTILLGPPACSPVTLYSSGSQTFPVHRPLGSIYTPTTPPTFFKKHKFAFVSTFILYLKNRLNKIIRVKLNVSFVN
jgi:hypothetical protein